MPADPLIGVARAAALECEGISAYCYTGGWGNPVPTVSGNPQADVAYVDRILGVKVAVVVHTWPGASVTPSTAPAATPARATCGSSSRTSGWRRTGSC